MQLRALSLVVFVATQAVAGGLTSAIHLCSQETKRDTCRCQHQQEQTSDLDAFRKLDCCKTSTVTAQAIEPVAADFRAQATQVAAPGALPVPFVLQVLPAPRAPSTWLVSGPAQGPPIFLKTHSLLN